MGVDGGTSDENDVSDDSGAPSDERDSGDGEDSAPGDRPAAVADAVRQDAIDDLTNRTADSLGTPAEDAVESLFDFSPLEGYRIVEHYWVNAPFAHAAILYDESNDERRYAFIEPALDDVERYIRQDLATTIRERLLDEKLEWSETGREEFDARVTEILAEEASALNPLARHTLRYYFRRDFLGFGPIDPFMQDPNIEDISCNGADVPVFIYHADYGNLETDLSFDAERLDSLAVKLAQRAGRHLSASTPLLTTTLPNGERIQVTLGSDVAARGSNFTIRKFREEPFTPVELIRYGTFSLAEMAYLWLAIEYNRSVLYVGPTASGKTTSMNATTMFIPPDHKVVSIEETREINLPHENWIADVTREADIGAERPEVNMYSLLSEALHQRPDHILVGEIRTDPDVVRAFFQAVGTGHAGFTTFHAKSPRDTLRRLRHDPLSVPDELLTDIDIISVQRLLSVGDERVRRSETLTELRVGEENKPVLHEVFNYDPRTDEIEQVANTKILREIAEEEGWDDERLRTELHERKLVLADLLQSGTTEFEPVTRALFRYARNPEKVLSDINEEALPELGRIEIADDG